MKLGELGIQVMVKSEEAFERIEFMEALEVDTAVYAPKRAARDEEARASYRRLQRPLDLQGIYLRDILVQEMTNDDPRLR